MTFDTKKILNEALLLSPIERAMLLEGIIATFNPHPLQEVERAWMKECRKRLIRYKKGKTKTFSSEEVFADLERDIKG